MKNPYRVGSWVVDDEFYGRTDLLREILAESAAGLWIIGNRRVGKTSLLRAAERLAANDARYLPLFWDMQGDTSETHLIQSLLEAIENAQWSEVDRRWKNVSLPEDARTINQAVRHVAAFARNHKCNLLLLCDEIEGLNEVGEREPHVLSRLRRVMQHNPATRTVLASTRRLSRLYAIQQQQDTSLFLEGLEPRYLTHFSDNTANELICCTQSTRSLVVDEALLKKLRFVSGNHPLILQKFCSQLFDPVAYTLRPFVDRDLVMDDQLIGTFQQDFNSLTPDEAKVLLSINNMVAPLVEIEQKFPDLSRGSLRRILYELTRLGFLRRIEHSYQAGNILLAEWLAAGPTSHTSPKNSVTKRMVHEVMQERLTALQRQLIDYYRQLEQLELRRAKQGIETSPHVNIQIEDCKRAIIQIKSELADLDEYSSFPEAHPPE